MIEVPTGRSDAADWLASQGYPAHQPAIRSSDLALVGECPFNFYLQRILGLVPGLSSSDARSRGSWFHTRCEALKSPNPQAWMVERWTQRLAELQVMGKAFGLSPEKVALFISDEKQDLNCAWGWFEAASRIPCLQQTNPERKISLEEYVNQEHWQVLETEARLVDTTGIWPRVAQPDGIWYHKGLGDLWLPDYKTCEESPKTRLETCPFEFQTRHNLDIARTILPKIIEKYQLPASTKLGGMMHICVQKPTIEFCGADRDHRLVDFTPSSGKNKGITRQEKEYLGEPKLENYIARCSRWYKGEEEYLDKQPEREANPPVAISYTSASLLSDDVLTEYDHQLRSIMQMTLCTHEPVNYYRTRDGMIQMGGKLSVYASFFAAHPSQWPELIAKQCLIVRHRDPDITPDSPSGVYPRA